MRPSLPLIASALVIALAVGCATPDRDAATSRATTRPSAEAPVKVPLKGLEAANAQPVRKALADLEGVASVEVLESEQVARIQMERGSWLSIAGVEKALLRTKVSLDAERMVLGPRLKLKLIGVRCPDC